MYCTFYRTQTPATYRKWASEVPDGFVFAAAANSAAAVFGSCSASHSMKPWTPPRPVAFGRPLLSFTIKPVAWMPATTGVCGRHVGGGLRGRYRGLGNGLGFGGLGSIGRPGATGQASKPAAARREWGVPKW
jgi:hypothetical protein